MGSIHNDLKLVNGASSPMLVDLDRGEPQNLVTFERSASLAGSQCRRDHWVSQIRIDIPYRFMYTRIQIDR